MRQSLAGQDVWVSTDGAGDARLFVHCSLGRSETLYPLAAALPPARNLFFDLPGHGRSGAWSGADYQSDVINVAAELLDGPAHLIGHSFGATVALRLAVERPDLVSRLTLIEPVMFAAAKGTAAYKAHQSAMGLFIAAWSQGDLLAATHAFIAMWGGGETWKAIPTRRQDALISQIHLIPAAAPAIEDDVHGIIQRLGDIICAVDLIEGAISQPIMSAILDGLEGVLGDVHRTVIDGAGHMVPLTHPRAVALALKGS